MKEEKPTTHDCSREKFLKAVEKLQMTVIWDNDVYRHIKFSAPDSITNWFEIVTWPGCLVIRGDYGTYAFARLLDMFQFFRYSGDKDEITINPSYWSEKILAYDQNNGVEKFYPDLMKASIQKEIDEIAVRDGWSDEDKKEVQEKLDEDLYPCLEDGEVRAYDALYSFGAVPHLHEIVSDGEGFTYHFIWCCYAIAWAVRQYDEYKEANP